MGYHSKKDEYHSSDRRNKSNYSRTRDYADVRTTSSHSHMRDSRDEQHYNKEINRKHDQTSYKHSKYRNRNFYPEDGSKINVTSRSLSPEKDRKYHSPEQQQNDKESYLNKFIKEELENKKDDKNKYKSKENIKNKYQENKNKDSDSDENNEESNIFSKYQQKVWKNKNSEQTDNDKRSSILIRCLENEVTEEQIENAVSDMAIRNGFSTPNSVVFKTFHTDSISGSLYSTDNKNQTIQYQEGYSYQYTLEKVAIVTFPSVSAASRFMSCNKSRSIKIMGREYYLEYDTSNNDNVNKNTNDPLIPAVSEIANLIQKRKITSDWNCPCCRFLNFARRVVCMACGIPKPTQEELESQNLAIELAAINQAKMLQSNLSDISAWVVIKNIPGDADPAKLVLTICKNIPNAPAELQRCIYVIDTNTETKRGFMFAQFSSNSVVEKYIEKRGDKKSEIVQCGNLFHRIDIVKSREKHYAEELFKKVKMNNLKVDYEYDTINGETNLTSEDNTMTQLNKEYKSCKVKTTNITTIQQHITWNDNNTTSQTFFSNWVSDCISLPGGKPDTGTFHYDPNTDYFFDHKLSLYYDAATSYYMSLTGNYYLWDEQSSSLRKVDPNSIKHRNQNQTNQQQQNQTTSVVQQNQQQYTDKIRTKETQKNEGSSISNILASAMKVAQVSQQNVQKLSTVKSENKQNTSTTTTTSNKSLNIVKTFEMNDEESDMEMEKEEVDKDNNKGENNKEQGYNNIINQKINTNQLKVNLNTNNQKNNRRIEYKENKIESNNICFLCLKTFDSFDNLKFHEKESKYHQALLTHIEVEP